MFINRLFIVVRSRPRVWLSWLVALGAVGALVWAQVARANTFLVTETYDAVDADISDDFCDVDSGTLGDQCTLRAAIQEANDTLGADIITLPAGTYTLTLVGSLEDTSMTGDLDILDEVTINGGGAISTTIDASGLFTDTDRVLHVMGISTTVVINDVTLTNGNPAAGTGGGVYLQDANLTLNSSQIISNTAAAGAGIYNAAGQLSLNQSVLYSNTATASTGGGVANVGGVLTLTTSSLITNTAPDGGGLYNSSVSTATVRHSAVISNLASLANGGGVFNEGALTLSNITLSGNTATQAGGGGYVLSGTAQLNNVTVVSNTADSGGGLAALSSTVDLKNSLLALNTATNPLNGADCFGTLGSQGYNLIGIHDLAVCTFVAGPGDQTGSLLFPLDPLLDALANNGGLTLTHLLLPGSPAIWGGNPALPGSGGNACELDDQRGVARDVLCDIGAFDGSEPPTPTPTATPTETETPTVTPTETETETPTPTATETETPTLTPTHTVTLTRTSTQTPTGTITPSDTPTVTSTITPTPTPTSTITPTRTPTSTRTPTRTRTSTRTPTNTSTPTHTRTPTITPTFTITPTPTQVVIVVDTGVDETTVNGRCSLREAILAANTDASVDACPAGNGADVITVPARTYTLTISGAGENGDLTGDLDITEDLTLNGANATSTIINGNGIDRVFHILSNTQVTFNNLTIRGGQEATGGGGLFNSGSNVLLTSVTVMSNTAGVQHGGGIYNDNGDLTLVNSTVRGNTGTEGGGLYNNGTLTFSASSLISNTASSVGGGIRNTTNGVTNLIQASVTNNVATTSNGGGIYSTGTLTILNSTIANNQSGSDGGGLEIRDSSSSVTSTLTLSNSTISGNVSVGGGGGAQFRGSGTTGPVVITIVNSTFSGNSTGTSGGGGFRNNTNALTTLTNVTIVNNSAGNNNGGGLRSSGTPTSTLTLRNVLLVNNVTGGNCDDPFTSAGYNMSSDGTCSASLSGPGDRNNVGVVIGALANNGGPTLTHALPVGPATNAGTGVGCPATDQRGVTRDRYCDIGAYEDPSRAVFLPALRR